MILLKLYLIEDYNFERLKLSLTQPCLQKTGYDFNQATFSMSLFLMCHCPCDTLMASPNSPFSTPPNLSSASRSFLLNSHAYAHCGITGSLVQLKYFSVELCASSLTWVVHLKSWWQGIIMNHRQSDQLHALFTCLLQPITDWSPQVNY